MASLFLHFSQFNKSLRKCASYKDIVDEISRLKISSETLNGAPKYLCRKILKKISNVPPDFHANELTDVPNINSWVTLMGVLSRGRADLVLDELLAHGGKSTPTLSDTKHQSKLVRVPWLSLNKVALAKMTDDNITEMGVSLELLCAGLHGKNYTSRGSDRLDNTWVCLRLLFKEITKEVEKRMEKLDGVYICRFARSMKIIQSRPQHLPSLEEDKCLPVECSGGARNAKSLSSFSPIEDEALNLIKSQLLKSRTELVKRDLALVNELYKTSVAFLSKYTESERKKFLSGLCVLSKEIFSKSLPKPEKERSDVLDFLYSTPTFLYHFDNKLPKPIDKSHNESGSASTFSYALGCLVSSARYPISVMSWRKWFRGSNSLMYSFSGSTPEGTTIQRAKINGSKEDRTLFSSLNSNIPFDEIVPRTQFITTGSNITIKRLKENSYKINPSCITSLCQYLCSSPHTKKRSYEKTANNKLDALKSRDKSKSILMDTSRDGSRYQIFEPFVAIDALKDIITYSVKQNYNSDANQSKSVPLYIVTDMILTLTNFSRKSLESLFSAIIHEVSCLINTIETEINDYYIIGEEDPFILMKYIRSIAVVFNSLPRERDTNRNATKNLQTGRTNRCINNEVLDRCDDIAFRLAELIDYHGKVADIDDNRMRGLCDVVRSSRMFSSRVIATLTIAVLRRLSTKPILVLDTIAYIGVALHPSFLTEASFHPSMIKIYTHVICRTKYSMEADTITSGIYSAHAVNGLCLEDDQIDGITGKLESDEFEYIRTDVRARLLELCSWVFTKMSSDSPDRPIVLVTAYRLHEKTPGVLNYLRKEYLSSDLTNLVRDRGNVIPEPNDANQYKFDVDERM